MGYVTRFNGIFRLDRPLAPHYRAYLQAFHEVTHYQWDVTLLADELDPVREAVGLPLGEHGCYFTGSRANFQMGNSNPLQLRYNYYPWSHVPGLEEDPAYLGSVCPGKPGRHCGWCPSDDGTALVEDEDKFYHYIEWLQYLLDHFLIPWGYVLQGQMAWQGEYEEDIGTIAVEKNVITVSKDSPLATQNE